MSTGTGGRATTQGYGAADHIRQQFTKKERDVETRLDYFGARYCASAQGRFTGLDAAGPDLSNPQTLNKYQYCLNNPLKHIDRHGLYEEDVHQDLTYVLALAVGFNELRAARIAGANQGVDDNSETSPMGMWPGGKAMEVRELHHFTTPARRDELWATFVRTGSDEDLGIFFHAQQDSFSHEKWGARTGHLWGGHGEDKTYNYPAKADRMAFDTVLKLQAALAIDIAKGRDQFHYESVGWKTIAPLVRAFNRAKSDEEKKKIIQQIMGVVYTHRAEQLIKRERVEREREQYRRKVN